MIGDVVVVGGGAAGLTAALRLCTTHRVTLVCKAPLGEGAATGWAQGGIAAAVGNDDAPELHAHDTSIAGGGTNDARAVELLTHDAPARIAELIALGATFDREADGRLALGQEAAHGRRRILHAGGDATGREILRALVAAVRASSIEIVVATARELVLERGRVGGIDAVRTLADGRRERIRIRARAVVLATGGFGRLYRYTTNPLEATGDGIVLAARAGAALRDLEFVQFHPTALDVGIDPMPLVTEALRGEGARIVDRNGDAIMRGVDPRGDLAPRDIVARAVYAAVLEGRRPALDARAIDDVERHFPTVAAAARAAGLSMRRDLLPIAPAAHYAMGGIAVDTRGRSSITGLWACGEVAGSGVHGANRLASNSLLEALVFGARVADDISSTISARPLRAVADDAPEMLAPIDAEAACETASRIAAIRERMYRDVGVVRHATGLRRTIDEFSRERATLDEHDEAADLLLLGGLIAGAAERRRESRGSHARSDFPLTDRTYARPQETAVHHRSAV